VNHGKSGKGGNNMGDKSNNKVNVYLRNASRELKSLREVFPEVLDGFYKFHEPAMKDGVLSVKIKELIATGIAMLVCTGECARFHAAQALRHGASRAEILETISVGMMMGGGPGVFHAMELIKSLEEAE